MTDLESVLHIQVHLKWTVVNRKGCCQISSQATITKHRKWPLLLCHLSNCYLCCPLEARTVTNQNKRNFYNFVLFLIFILTKQIISFDKGLFKKIITLLVKIIYLNFSILISTKLHI